MGGLNDKLSIRDALGWMQQRWPNVASDSAATPVFIFSAGWRSGSTWLQRMLMPSCFIWGEPYGHIGLIDTMADQIRGFSDTLPEPHFIFDGSPAKELSERFIANLYPSPEELLRAHLAYFQKLFVDPAKRCGPKQWGLKEVRLTADHAFYLKWLFPRARFIFLYRNPYDAYRSFAARRNIGWNWYVRWPDHPISVSAFGSHWRSLLEGFMEHHQAVGGLMVRYEDIKQHDFQAIEDYLGLKLCRSAAQLHPADGPPPLESIPAAEKIELDAEVAALANVLGYRDETAPAPREDLSVHVGETLDPSRCVVLAPVGSHIEPECDAALYELQRRGYEVRRVRGYAAIDQGRNQMATDALADGFTETMWIDSDVAFHPDAVDQLRAHRLPIVCGIYPQKGRRALSCHMLPTTQRLIFGEGGGLVEILYAATGFLLVRRCVYEDLQMTLNLPLCNERFARPMVPYFQPLVRPDHNGHWYLAEDFAFSERARRCGYRIMADSTIRLKHIGAYGFSWEDAGRDVQRFATFNFQLGKTAAAEEQAQAAEAAVQLTPLSDAEFNARLQDLAQAHPWPAQAPDVPPEPEKGWLFSSTREMLQSVLGNPCRLVVEVGSFLGLSTRFIADTAPTAAVVAIDHWAGSPEHQTNPDVAPLLPMLFETFTVNCWSYRDRMIALRMDSVSGLQEVARRGLHPDVVYIDGDHSFAAVVQDVETTLDLFPGAVVVGDDWDWEGVRRGVRLVADRRRRSVEVRGVAWRLT